MLTLDVSMHIPEHVRYSVVGEDAFLLNTRTNRYFLLEDVGSRLWRLLKDGKLLRESYQILLDEYEIDSSRLEQDILDLIGRLVENHLVEVIRE
jgi:hypothetical protein